MERERSVKNLSWFLLYFAIGLLFFFGLGAQAESEYQIRLNENSIELAKGKTFQVVASLEGSKAKYSWTSEDISVATVNTNGTITAKGNGTTNIVCTALLADREVSATILVKVFTPVQGLKLPQSISVDVGNKTDALPVTFTPEDASNKQLEWETDNPAIATVNEKGVISGIAVGTCKVTATSTDFVAGNSKPQKASIKVIVLQPVSSIKVETKELAIARGKSYKVSYAVLPENSSSKKVMWSSANSTIASVNNGTITGKESGDTIISVFTGNADGSEVKTDIHVHVYSPVTAVSINEKAKGIALYPGESVSLSYRIKPEDAEYSSVRWVSSDNTIATVDSITGTVKGVSPGQVTITASSTEPLVGSGAEKKDTIKVRILTPIKSFTVRNPSVVFTNEKNKKIAIANIQPKNATNKEISFHTRSSAIATVSNSGVINAHNTGVATIEMRAQDDQGASKNIKLWCFDSKRTITEKNKAFKENATSFYKLIGELRKMKSMVDTLPGNSEGKQTAEKSFASSMSLTVLTYLAAQEINGNDAESELEYSTQKPSYCFIGSRQFWSFLPKKNSSNYEGYGFIKAPGGEYYLTHVTLSAIFQDGFMNERFDDDFIYFEVPADTFTKEIKSMINLIW